MPTPKNANLQIFTDIIGHIKVKMVNQKLIIMKVVKNYLYYVSICFFMSFLSGLLVWCLSSIKIAYTKETITVVAIGFASCSVLFSSLIYFLAVYFSCKSSQSPIDDSLDEIYVYMRVREWAGSRARKNLIYFAYFLFYAGIAYCFFDIGHLFIPFGWSQGPVKFVVTRLVVLSFVYFVAYFTMVVNVPLLAVFKNDKLI